MYDVAKMVFFLFVIIKNTKHITSFRVYLFYQEENKYLPIPKAFSYFAKLKFGGCTFGERTYKLKR